MKTQPSLNNLFEKASIAILLADSQHNVIDANPLAVELLGYDKEKMLKFNARDLLHPDDLRRMPPDDTFKKLMSGEVVDVERKFRKRDGTYLDVLVSMRILGDYDGRCAHVIMFQDITTRKNAEKALVERIKELRCISSLGKIVEEKDVSLDSIFQKTIRLLPPAWQYTKSAVGRIRFHDRSFQTGDFDSCVSRLSSNLKIREEVVGAIEVAYMSEFPEADIGPFLIEEQDLLDILAERLAKVVERRQTEDALRMSEERNRTLIKTIPDLVWLKDPKGVYLSCNPSFENFFGATESEIVGKTDHDFKDKELADFFRAQECRAIESGKACANEECLIFASDGYRGSFETIRTPMHDSDGKLISVLGIARDITERKQTAEALQASREKYRLLADNTRDVIWAANMDLVFTYVNPAVSQLTGYTPEECIGTHMSAYFYGECLGKAEDLIRQSLKNPSADSGLDFETVFFRKDGAPVPVETQGKVVFNDNGFPVGLQGMVRDLTERRRSEEQLRKNEELLNATGDLAKIGGWEVEFETEKIHWTRTSKAIHGVPEDFVPTMDQVFDFYEPEIRPTLLKAFQHAYYDGTGFDLEMPFISASGHRLWMHVIGRPEFQDGKCVRIHGIMQDITDRQIMEKQLRQAQKLESIGQLAAGIAHEINTPIQYVGDNVHFFKDAFEDLFKVVDSYERLIRSVPKAESGDSCLREHQEILEETDIDFIRDEIPLAIEQTREGIDQVTRIVRSMKDFSHPAMEEKIFVDINKALESTITISRNEWKYVAEMQMDFEEDLPLVACFPGEINQVILNIIVNAAHAIGEIVGKDDPEKGLIKVTTRSSEDTVEILISDTGTGIPEKSQPYVFDPFYTTKGVGKGTGQGLSLAYSTIIEKHKGCISFETEVGKGTTFVIRLPL